MPRELGQFPPDATHLILRLPREQAWAILDALQHLCDDPNLLALEEQDGKDFIVAAGYAVFVRVGDETVTVLTLTKLGAN